MLYDFIKKAFQSICAIAVLTGIVLLLRVPVPRSSYAIWHKNGKITFMHEKPNSNVDSLGEIVRVTPVYY